MSQVLGTLGSVAGKVPFTERSQPPDDAYFIIS